MSESMDTDPLVIRMAEYVKSAVKAAHYPPANYPEAAFAGRSNVGKSSLINCLVQRKKLVRTSRTPGQTQTINFFLINGSFYLVDLPGYGFAKAPERVRAQWGPMVESYLTGRTTLRGVVQLLDARHLPTVDDVNLWQWLRGHSIPAVPVLTKSDKLVRGNWSAALRQASSRLGVSPDEMILFSSVSGQGRRELLEILAGWVSAPVWPEEA